MRIFYYAVLALLALFVLFTYGCKSTGSLMDVQAVKVAPEQDANAVKVQADEISAIKESLNSFEKLFESISAKMAVVDKSSKEDIGRDKTVINDTGLMKEVMHYWWLVFLGIIGIMKWNSRGMAKRYEKQLAMILDKNNKQVRQLQIEKDDYKTRYLSVGVKNEQELSAFRKMHLELKREKGVL